MLIVPLKGGTTASAEAVGPQPFDPLPCGAGRSKKAQWDQRMRGPESDELVYLGRLEVVRKLQSVTWPPLRGMDGGA